jgi:hypothetical protein
MCSFPDLERHVEAIEAYAQAGFDELYIQQIGEEQERFCEVYSNEVLPRFRESDGRDGTSTRKTIEAT